MSKVIAIIEKPKDCHNCIFGIFEYACPVSTHRKAYSCRLKEPQDRVIEDFDYDEEVHLRNCPLKEVPEKKNSIYKYPSFSYGEGWDKGYNACIDKILEGSEQNETD